MKMSTLFSCAHSLAKKPGFFGGVSALRPYLWAGFGQGQQQQQQQQQQHVRQAAAAAAAAGEVAGGSHERGASG
jgi:hypothetical protein